MNIKWTPRTAISTCAIYEKAIIFGQADIYPRKLPYISDDVLWECARPVSPEFDLDTKELSAEESATTLSAL